MKFLDDPFSWNSVMKKIEKKGGVRYAVDNKKTE